MSRARLFLAAAPLLLAACADGPAAPRALAVADDAPLAAAAPTRPHAGSCTSVFSTLPPVSGQAPNVIRLTIAYDCRLTHLGRTTGLVTQTVTFGPGGVGQIVNSTTYTAANGDQLFATFVGTGTPTADGFVLDGTETYTGGTGRFAGASGSADLDGTARFTGPASGVGAFDVRGTLAY